MFLVFWLVDKNPELNFILDFIDTLEDKAYFCYFTGTDIDILNKLNSNGYKTLQIDEIGSPIPDIVIFSEYYNLLRNTPAYLLERIVRNFVELKMSNVKIATFDRNFYGNNIQIIMDKSIYLPEELELLFTFNPYFSCIRNSDSFLKHDKQNHIYYWHKKTPNLNIEILEAISSHSLRDFKDYTYPIDRTLSSLKNIIYPTPDLKDFLTGYNSDLFKRIDKKIFSEFVFSNPYYIAFKEGTESDMGKNLTYGETPWVNIVKVLKLIDIQKNDVFYELGCGTGRISILVNQYFNVQVIGIDYIKKFIKIANKIVRELDIKNINFLSGNFLEHDLSNGTIFYVTPTCFDDIILEGLIKKLESIANKSRVISVSRDLNCNHLILKHKINLPYYWGKDNVYIYEKEG